MESEKANKLVNLVPTDSFEKITKESKLHSFCMYIIRIKAKHCGKITTFYRLHFVDFCRKRFLSEVVY